MSRLYDLSASVVRGLYDLRIHAPALLDSEVEFPLRGAASPRNGQHCTRKPAASCADCSGFHASMEQLMESQTDISANDGRDWRMFVVKAYGVPIAPNLAACPVLATLLDRTPQAVGLPVVRGTRQAHPGTPRAVTRRAALPISD